jgi:hypothetical protein
VQYGIHIFELRFPHSINESSIKILKIKVFDFKNKKKFIASIGDKLKILEYINESTEIDDNIIPINQDVFLKILNTYADNIIGTNKVDFFKKFLIQEWII